MSISNNLIEISELMELLGYSDMRSVRKFCSDNKVPLINLGKKTYTVNDFLDRIIARELSKNYGDADLILDAINNDDKEGLSKLIEAPADSNVKKQYHSNKVNSKAAKNLINKLNEL